MRWPPLVLLAMLAPAGARATEAPPDEAEGGPKPPYVYAHMARALVGLGGVPTLPSDDRTANVVLTAEIGGHPLSGALGTGVSVSSALDFAGLWSVLTPGLFAKVDLTYVFLTGLWRYPPPSSFPFRILLGGRLGVGISQSTRPAADVPHAVPYVLVRPELQDFLDVELPVGRSHAYSLVLRSALDTPVNLSSVFRWSFSFGINYGWGS